MKVKDIIAKKLIKTNEVYQAQLLENDENEYIAIKCPKGHLYRMSLTDPNFNYRVENCPFCLQIKKKIFKNAKYLPHNVNCMQSLADLFDNYIKWRIEDNQSIFQYIDYTFVYQIDENTTDMTDKGFNKNNVVDKRLSDLDIRHLNNLYTYEVDDFNEVILPALKKILGKDTDIIKMFLQAEKEIDTINTFNEHTIIRENISYCIYRAVRYHLREFIQNEIIDNNDVETLDDNQYYYNGGTIVTKEMLLEKKGISTPKLVKRPIEIYNIKESIYKNKQIIINVDVKDLESQIAVLEMEIQEKTEEYQKFIKKTTSKIKKLKHRVNVLNKKRIE